LTESELIGLYDKTGDILWTRNFPEAQGYTISTNIVYQDNMSTLSLAKNGSFQAPNVPNTSRLDISLFVTITTLVS
jgi:hypothetical protein